MRTATAAALLLSCYWLGWLPARAGEPTRARRFEARTPAQARHWQESTRQQLFTLLMGGHRPQRVPLEPQTLRQIEVSAAGCVLEEVTLQSLPDRRVHAWLARPLHPQGKVGGVLALHGHGGTGQQMVLGQGLYWYGRAAAEMGYALIAPDIGQHDLQHTNWCLMGERVWDALCCLDYLAARPEVDPGRLAVAGLSLGGETTMYVAALDQRLKAACSSGWLTTVENMKNGHCPCWNFPGLEANFDFADIFACIAPRRLVCEVGQQERAPGGFPVSIARGAFAQIKAAYGVFKAEQNLALTVHPAGHVFNGQDFWPKLHQTLGLAYPWAAGQAANATELLRRGEIARRNFCRALGVLDSWWALRDPVTGLFPRRVDQPVWAPNDNAADMLPFLALTAYYVAPHRLAEVLLVIPKERALTDRLGVMPDWFALTNRAFVYPSIDTNRLVFCAAEYCKDGLLPMTEVMGRGIWTERMFELVDAIFANAPVVSDFGNLPANDTEVNGETLQVLSRLYFMSGEAKYLQWAQRIGDAYCLEVIPRNGGIPAGRWDFTLHRPISDEFSLNDHGNEIVGGLSELYLAVSAGAPGKAAQYRQSLMLLANRLLDKARNPDGLWVQRLRASTAEVLDGSTPDTWGYALSGIVTLGLATGDQAGPRNQPPSRITNHGPRFTDLVSRPKSQPSTLKPLHAAQAAQTALSHLDQGRYLDWIGADSYADSIEGGLVLLNRFPVKPGLTWLDKVLPIFLGKQRDDGIVEGWYGDGNYARTALMAALYHTQGLRCQPWSPSLRFGALGQRQGLRAAIQSDDGWAGRLIFDRPRHRLHLNLPINYPRLNEFPEWFTVESGATYELKPSRGSRMVKTGAQLAEGVFLSVKAGETLIISVTRR